MIRHFILLLPEVTGAVRFQIYTVPAFGPWQLVVSGGHLSMQQSFALANGIVKARHQAMCN